MTGPPQKPPPRCWLNGALPDPCAWEKESCASSFSLRSKKKTRPSFLFVPERVTTLTIAPDEIPYSAENWLASTIYSRTDSSEKPPRDDETIVSSLLTPSTRY